MSLRKGIGVCGSGWGGGGFCLRCHSAEKVLGLLQVQGGHHAVLWVCFDKLLTIVLQLDQKVPCLWHESLPRGLGSAGRHILPQGIHDPKIPNPKFIITLPSIILITSQPFQACLKCTECQRPADADTPMMLGPKVIRLFWWGFISTAGALVVMTV